MSQMDALTRVEFEELISSPSINESLGQRLEVCTSLSVEQRAHLMQQANSSTKELIQLLNTKYMKRQLLVIPKPMRKGIVIASDN